MRETSLPEGPAGLTAGRLEGMSVPDLMWLLCRKQATGVLHLIRGPITKKVYFQDGRIVFSASSDPNDRLGEMLLRQGQIELEHLEQAIAHLHQGKRLGTILVEMGYLQPEDLVRGVVTQVREVVLGLFTWEEGAYRFDEGPLPTQEVITLGMKTGEILLQGIRRVRSFARIRRSVGGLRQRYALSSAASGIVEGLELTDAERLLLQRLRRGSASIETLCREIYASNFELHQALWGLKVLGAVDEAEGTGDSAAAPASLEGRLGPEGIVGALVRLCRAGETGVLHVTRGPAERTFHLREGRCVFATSNNFDDGLIAHLLRRGVISIFDREETAKRLLSNKRVGTILLDMGVLDERDLREMVREQLCEIVCDTFRWVEGEYAFVPGELPTIEDIVLEMSLEDLVSEGIRRVTSWSRVRGGCGGSAETVLTLTEKYLDVLDRMAVGADEWEVVTCLHEPRALSEICRLASLGDFRVCQILWALRLLGAVRECSASEAAALSSPRPQGELGDDRTALAAPGGDQEVAGEHGEPPPAEPPAESVPLSPDEAPVVEGDNAAASSRAGAEPDAIPVAPPDETPVELVTETWQLTGDSFAPPPRIAEAPQEGAPQVEAASIEEAGDAVGTPPEPAQAAPAAPETPPVDSPADATLVLSRAEVESALGIAPPAPDGAEFELAEPGTGTDLPFAEQAAIDALGGRDFEIGEPAPEAPEPAAAPSGEPEPAFELATEPGNRAVEPPPEHARPSRMPEPAQTAEVPPDVVARALGVAPPASESAGGEGVEENAGASALESLALSIPEPARPEALPAPDAPPESVASPPEAADGVLAPAAEPEAASIDETPIAELDRAITRFNQLHRLLYRAIRSEVGAGTVNFIQACRFGLGKGHDELFAGSRLLPDGTWDPEGLRKAMRERQEREPWSSLERLLDREFEMLRPQIGENRLRALHEQLSELRQTR